MSEDIFLVVQVRDDEDHNFSSAAAVDVEMARNICSLDRLVRP
jgi:hypothetical protein